MVEVFPALGKSATAVDLADRSLDNPALRQNQSVLEQRAPHKNSDVARVSESASAVHIVIYLAGHDGTLIRLKRQSCLCRKGDCVSIRWL